MTPPQALLRHNLATCLLKHSLGGGAYMAGVLVLKKVSQSREFVDYKTSVVTDEDPLRGLLFY